MKTELHRPRPISGLRRVRAVSTNANHHGFTPLFLWSKTDKNATDRNKQMAYNVSPQQQKTEFVLFDFSATLSENIDGHGCSWPPGGD